MSDRVEQTKALASKARTKILEWLKEPRHYFNRQQTADPADISVCVTRIADKLDMSQPTVNHYRDLVTRRFRRSKPNWAVVLFLPKGDWTARVPELDA